MFLNNFEMMHDFTDYFPKDNPSVVIQNIQQKYFINRVK